MQPLDFEMKYLKYIFLILIALVAPALFAMPQAAEKTEGGILKASQTIRDEEVSNICGYVLKLGPDAYNDKNRFPSGPWCKQGDWVVFRAYSGTRMKMYGQEFRLINDDTVEAVVEDPTGVVRA